MTEVSPCQAHARQQRGALLLDVRESDEQAAGMAQGAVALPWRRLVAGIDTLAPDNAREILVICAGGQRSARAAVTLMELGYRRVASVAGGTRRWVSEGLPVTLPSNDLDFHERYSRHLRLDEIGETGQRTLQAARVVLLGAGGLGSPAALYLAAAGIGTLVIADDDVVELSNLQRQILHAETRIGTAKVASAKAALLALNPRVQVVPVQERITAGNVEALLEGADVVIDGADNFPVRYLLNDVCVKLGKPLVYGAIERFHGQVSVFDAGRQRGLAPCYRCLFPRPPAPADAPNCAQAGVLGVLPGIVGTLQATEAMKLVLGIGEPLTGRLLLFDALRMHFREIRVAANPDCPVCADRKTAVAACDHEPALHAGGNGYPVGKSAQNTNP